MNGPFPALSRAMHLLQTGYDVKKHEIPDFALTESPDEKAKLNWGSTGPRAQGMLYNATNSGG